jgi:BirA family biotin operon repressor/biotin-[acetyl-CoA-carboxylase] ligase
MKTLDGWTYYHYDELGSTNDKIADFCTTPKQRFIVCCKSQTAGRGRRGRSWLSLQNNLFFSLAFEFNLCYIGHLVIISALSLAQSISELDSHADISLKWPNDVLLNNAKVSGILLEKGKGEYIIIGIGVNISASPDDRDMLYPTVSLAEAGIKTTPQDFLSLYIKHFNSCLRTLENYGFAPLKEKWLSLAGHLGKEICVKQENTVIRGIFCGIDDNARLLLKTPNAEQKIMVGDIFYIESKYE